MPSWGKDDPRQKFQDLDQRINQMQQDLLKLEKKLNPSSVPVNRGQTQNPHVSRDSVLPDDYYSGPPSQRNRDY